MLLERPCGEVLIAFRAIDTASFALAIGVSVSVQTSAVCRVGETATDVAREAGHYLGFISVRPQATSAKQSHEDIQSHLEPLVVAGPNQSIVGIVQGETFSDVRPHAVGG